MPATTTGRRMRDRTIAAALDMTGTAPAALTFGPGGTACAPSRATGVSGKASVNEFTLPTPGGTTLSRDTVGTRAQATMSDPRDNEVRATEGSPSAGNNVVHDCGLIINPDGLKNQIEGNVIQTVRRTLLQELAWDRSKVTSLDWARYPIISFLAVPEVVIELIDRPNEKPWEPSAAVIPSAISNAVFDSIGVRVRSAPFTLAKVKAATRLI